MPRLSLLLLPLLLATALPAAAEDDMTLPELGEVLFHDPNLSLHRTQSCATCHDPDRGFADPRADGAHGAVSLGDDGRSLGSRNAPTAAYAAAAPAFRRLADGTFAGGFFLDGRASSLEEQAGGPPLNPAEMAMPSADLVVERLREKPAYVAAFDRLFGTGTLDDPERGYAALSQAIAAFERSPAVSPFDSRYDRSLRGEVRLTDQEELGRLLFFSQQFTNCNQCHQLKSFGGVPGETFTDYSFHNIGVPANPALDLPAPDIGLAGNPAAEGAGLDGRFKVPTLRNVAVTGPYMHNGVFKDLRTVVLFYNRYNLRHPERLKNPETGEPFGPPEIDGTLSLEKLTHGPALKDKEIDALVAFLKTLTDRRYEPLLNADAAGTP